MFYMMLFLRYFVLFAQNYKIARLTLKLSVLMPEALTFVIIYSCKWPHKYFFEQSVSIFSLQLGFSMKFQATKLSFSIFSVSPKVAIEHYNSQATSGGNLAPSLGGRKN